jgi:prepilin-type processing-associated H-X9-DG protein
VFGRGQEDELVAEVRRLRKLGDPPLGTISLPSLAWGDEELFAHEEFYNHIGPINEWTFVMPPGGYGMFPASSLHTGGVNVAYLDGHVEFIAESIDMKTWRRLGTINGND